MDKAAKSGRLFDRVDWRSKRNSMASKGGLKRPASPRGYARARFTALRVKEPGSAAPRVARANRGAQARIALSDNLTIEISSEFLAERRKCLPVTSRT